jgi:hypothetical protein
MNRPVSEREEFIRSLVANLRPVRWPGRVFHWLVAWLSLAAVFSAVAIAVTGPFRDGAILSLVRYPGFAAETLVAAMAVILLAHASLMSSIPDPAGRLPLLKSSVAILGIWLSFYVVGFWFPAHPVMNLGYRDHCLAQTQLIALVNLVALLWFASRLVALQPRLTGALAGATAAAVPAAIMQFACMYEPEHILIFHFGPVVSTAAIGWLLGPALLMRWSRSLRIRGERAKGLQSDSKS